MPPAEDLPCAAAVPEARLEDPKISVDWDADDEQARLVFGLPLGATLRLEDASERQYMMTRIDKDVPWNELSMRPSEKLQNAGEAHYSS
jgi:hypothetical protein